MATVMHRWMAVTDDGRMALFEIYADNSFHLVVMPEGVSGTVPIDDCHEALYDRNGTLIVAREPGAEVA